MIPLDGRAFAKTEVMIEPSASLVLPGGRVALVIEDAPFPLPTAGTLAGSGPWIACGWPRGDRFAGCALLPSMPQNGAELRDAEGNYVGTLGRPTHIDVAAAPLLKLIRGEGAKPGELFSFLHRHLASTAKSLITEFLAGAAQQDGFIEVAARPECGGLFLQGWAQSLAAGPARVLGLASCERTEIDVAVFSRDDILPPGSGVCLFIKKLDESHPIPSAVYFERDGRLRRLDVVPDMAPAIVGARATTHVKTMLGRMDAPRQTLGAFRRICRPRYEGQDTLSGYGGPVAAALDRVLRAADGTLLVSGWILDPLARVEHVILKSASNLYAPLHKTWNLLPRPDLVRGFAEDRRFAGLLDEREVMHGFITHAPAKVGQSDDLYLEIVLDDGSCLFRPVAVTPCQGAGALTAALGGISPDEPQLQQIVEGHLAPFLAGIERRPVLPLRRTGRPVPLGRGLAGRSVAAVMPVASLADLQPIFATLAETSDATGLDLTLVAGRRVAADVMAELDDAFDFYGLTGQIVICPDHAPLAARLDAGVAASRGPRVLIWQPSALPKSPGWLARLCGEADRLGSGLISPALLYEDGSIYFGGARRDIGAKKGVCARAGFGGHALDRGDTVPVSAGAAEIAMIDRVPLERAGGVTGRLFGDAYTHLDLSRRLRAVGAQAWCARSVEFWMLEDPCPEDDAPMTRMTRAIDAALIARLSPEKAA